MTATAARTRIGPERQPQDNEDDHAGDDAVEGDPFFLHAGKFIVRYNDRARETSISPELGTKSELMNDLSNRGCGSAAGFKRIAVEHRPNLDVTVKIRGSSVALHQSLPRELRRVPLRNALQSDRGRVQRTGHAVERQEPLFRIAQKLSEDLHKAPEARIVNQSRDHGLDLRQLPGEMLDLFERQE